MTQCTQCGKDVVSGSGGFCAECALQTRTFAAPAAPASQQSSQPVLRPASHTPATRFLPGDVLVGRYRIVALLGRGGMGEVYRADDLSLDQPVALKFLATAATRDQSAVTRFRNEVRIARQVSHPNVCRVYDLAEVEGDYFLSMEYVDGEDLGSLIRRIGRLPEDKALEISRRLCAGLAAAHERGVLHRDLKPANVMLDGRGQVLLTDFGLAGIAGEIAGNEVRNGTPAYMAPEQLAGREVTVRSDLYSLGLVLHELFTGRKPEDSKTPTSFVRDLDPIIERVILRCLERDPAGRPISALAVSAALPGGDPLAAALAAGETPSPQMVAAAGEGSGLRVHHASLWLAGVLIGLVALAIYSAQASYLNSINPPYSPEVLRQKAHDLIADLGYSNRRGDSAFGFDWDNAQMHSISDRLGAKTNWNQLAHTTIPVLRFWYRQSEAPLTGQEFKDDRLTPGIVTFEDPLPVEAGMISLILTPDARLVRFEAMPDQKRRSLSPLPGLKPVEWNKLFQAAKLDPTLFHEAAPEWTFLATSDTRKAWVGTVPGDLQPIRIEAGSFEGRPTAWDLIGPWKKGERNPGDLPSWSLTGGLWFSILITLSALIWAPLLARKNLRGGSADRNGAFRIATFLFFVQLALWILRGHFVASGGTAGMGFVAVATSFFYAGFVWAIYLAFEPQVRRRWPQALISWSAVLRGKWRDSVVGRDVLYGLALALSWQLIGAVAWFSIHAGNPEPQLSHTRLLLGSREMLGAWLFHVPGSIRETLLFFLLIFGLRVLLKRELFASALFVLIFSVSQVFQSRNPIQDGVSSALIYGMIATIVFRVGLFPLAIGLLAVGVLDNVPVTFNTSDWYFSNALFIYGSIAALAVAAFRIAVKAPANSATLR